MPFRFAAVATAPFLMGAWVLAAQQQPQRMEFVPSIMWSRSATRFGGEIESYHVNTVSEEAFVDALQFASDKDTNRDGTFVADALPPKITLGFVFDALSMNDLAESVVLSSMMRFAKSSVVLPYSSRQARLDPKAFADLFAGPHSTIILESSSVQPTIQNEVESSSGSKTVIIYLGKSKMLESEELIESVNDLLTELVPSGDFLMFVTAAQGRTVSIPDRVLSSSDASENELGPFGRGTPFPKGWKMEDFFPPSTFPRDGRRVLTEVFPTGAIRNSPEAMISMVITLILALTLYLYFCCLHSIQGGTTYADRYPAKGKTFE